MNVPTALSLLFNLLFLKVQGGIINGEYRGSESWVFLEKFVFQAGNNGSFTTILYFPSGHYVNLLAYFDGANEFDTFAKLHDGPYTCQEKIEAADFIFDLQSNQFEHDYKSRLNGEWYREVKVDVAMQTSRPRWMFLAVSNCLRNCKQEYCDGGVDLDYFFNFTNGGGVNQYFSYNEHGIFQTHIVFCLFYSLLLLYSLRVKSLLSKQRKFHMTVALLMCSSLFSMLSVFCNTISLARYSSVGTPLNGFVTLSIIFAGFAEFTLILQVMLIAKGWTIVRRKISAMGRVRIAVYMTIYIAWYWACMMYYEFGIGKESVVYVYDTWPGTVLVLLRVLCFMWLLYAVHVTLKKYHSKKLFYFKFKLFIGAWILVVPFMAIVNSQIAEYAREKVMVILLLICTFAVQTALTMMYNPKGPWSKSFPFHATTASMLGSKVGSTNHIKDAHLRQAVELSRRIRKSIATLEEYSTDLNRFLDAIDPADDELFNKDQDFGNTESRKKPSTITSVPGPGSDNRPPAKHAVAPPPS